MHIAHGFLKARLTLVKFVAQHLQLGLQRMDINIKAGDIVTNRINGLTLIGNLVVKHHQVLQAFLYILLISAKATLLLLDLIADLRLLILQTIDCRLFGCCLLLGGLPLLSCRFLFRGSSTRLSGGCSTLYRRLTSLLSRNSRH